MHKVRLMDNQKEIIPKRFEWGLHLIPSILFAFLAREIFAFFIPLLCIAALYWGLNLRIIPQVFFYKRAQKQISTEARSKLVQLIGKEPKYIDTDLDRSGKGISGCGIAYNDGNIYLLQDGEAAVIPWEFVRSWSWVINGYQKIVTLDSPLTPTGVASGIKAQDANMKAVAEAVSQSGFFVKVADIDHPVWQFNTINEEVLQRWHEIFNQLKDGSGRLPNE